MSLAASSSQTVLGIALLLCYSLGLGLPFFIAAMLSIRQEIDEVEKGVADAKDNVLINAPHPEYEAVADEWKHSYPRSKAIYPTAEVAANKFFVPVAKVDNGFGDRNLVARFA